MGFRKNLLLWAALAATPYATADTLQLQWRDLVPEGPTGPGTGSLGPIDLVLTVTGHDLYRRGVISPSLLTDMTISFTSADGEWGGTMSYQVMPLFYVPTLGGPPVDALCCSILLYYEIGDRYFESLDIRAIAGGDGGAVHLTRDAFNWSTRDRGTHFRITSDPIVVAVPEPATPALLLAGLALVAAWGGKAPRRRKAHAAFAIAGEGASPHVTGSPHATQAS